MLSKEEKSLIQKSIVRFVYGIMTTSWYPEEGLDGDETKEIADMVLKELNRANGVEEENE